VDCIASIIRVTRIGELGQLAATINGRTLRENTKSMILSTLMMEAIRSSETLVPTKAIRRHIPEDGIRHSHRREKLKSYKLRIRSIKNGVFWDVTPRGSCKNRRFGGT
jgi:hypothetical protein